MYECTIYNQEIDNIVNIILLKIWYKSIICNWEIDDIEEGNAEYRDI